MPKYDKHVEILKKLVRYCNEIDMLVERFGKSREVFISDFAYQRACAMCILQIGELSSRLSEEFRSKYAKVAWAHIRGMRNIFAHEYERADPRLVWETIENRVPELKAYCEEILAGMQAIE